MSKFLSFLGDLGAYTPSFGDVLKTLAATGGGRSQTIQSNVDPTIADGPSPSTPFRDFVYDDGAAVIFPQDLGATGKEARIVFHIRSSNQNDTKLYKRIALYMPPGIKVDYGAGWESLSIPFTKLGAADVINDATNMMRTSIEKSGAPSTQDVTNLFKDVFKADLNLGAYGVIKGSLDGSSTILPNSSITREVLQYNRLALNPHSSLTFNTIEPRQFQFNFQLYARSKKESKDIYQIVSTFKWAMHPSATKKFSGLATKIFWDYPHVFDVFMMTPDHNSMFNISQSALTNISVSYGENSTSFFEYSPLGIAYPTMVNLSLTFKELEILTKERIEQGY